jgi:MoxR-like ATPase
MSVEHTQNLIRAVSILIQTNTPALLVGEPGVAKTAIVEALMSELCTVSDTRIASLS